MEIDINYNITPEFQDNEEKDTVAMWLTKKYKLVPKQWMHNYQIKNKQDKTLKDIMKERKMIVP